MSIKSDYKKARANYLSRVRRLESLGYHVERISTPKKPTKASISKLEKQTTKNLKNKSPLYDILTGEIYKPTGKSNRTKIETTNAKNISFAKEVQKQLSNKPKKIKINVKLSDQLKIGGSSIPFSDDIAIQNFYEAIETFIPNLQPFLKSRMDELLGDNSPEHRAQLAKTLRENPDYLPTPADSRESTISYKFSELERILNLNLEQFQQMQDLANTNGITM